MIRRNRGFTLIELMIAVVIVAILASIAVPSYREYLLRSNRTDAKTTLLALAVSQEKFFLQNNRYVTDTSDLEQLGITRTENDWYGIKVGPGVADDGGYLIEVSARAGERQFDDKKCRTFGINANSRRFARDADNGGGDDVDQECWGR